METYFSVSLNGSFVFRTDAFSNDPQGAARAHKGLEDAFRGRKGYKVTRYDRPASWATQEVV